MLKLTVLLTFAAFCTLVKSAPLAYPWQYIQIPCKDGPYYLKTCSTAIHPTETQDDTGMNHDTVDGAAVTYETVEIQPVEQEASESFNRVHEDKTPDTAFYTAIESSKSNTGSAGSADDKHEMNIASDPTASDDDSNSTYLEEGNVDMEPQPAERDDQEGSGYGLTFVKHGSECIGYWSPDDPMARLKFKNPADPWCPPNAKNGAPLSDGAFVGLFTATAAKLEKGECILYGSDTAEIGFISEKHRVDEAQCEKLNEKLAG